MWKNIVGLKRPQITKWRMRTSRCVPKAKNTHSEYVIIITFPLQQWLHERSSVLRYSTESVCLSCLLVKPADRAASKMSIETI